MFDLTTWMTYAFFVFCLMLGWSAAGALDFDGILRRSTSQGGRLLLRVGVALVLAEGFRLFLSFVLGPVVDMFVNQSINGFKAF
ncbi:putative membrane protein [Candidatus Desulfosporosinus infrequens]|uniref:Putative membrane protein n=1 Tax=Candidatus Desulfosporosinus infrequens TaxID=2043169 RepID=A0A2U3LPB2_9FIRM|nr:putative membrane protein [Candidatus Desulfosporosinus infrequens]